YATDFCVLHFCAICLLCVCCLSLIFFFFFNDTSPTEIYTLSLHDALPISYVSFADVRPVLSALSDILPPDLKGQDAARAEAAWTDRKSTRLNSSHVKISYAVFCLKKKKKNYQI